MPSRITTIPLSRILPAPQHVRSSFDKASIAALAESIRRFGLLSPLLVRRRSAGEYELIAGARRLQALKSLGCREAEAIVLIAYDGDCTLISLIENIQREELHFLDEARACRRLLDEQGLTQEELAAVLTRSPSALANRLRLLKLSEPVQAFIRKSSLSERHARALLRLSAEETQLALAHQCAADKWSVRRLEAEIEKNLRPAPILREIPKLRDKRLVVNAFRSTIRKLRQVGVEASSRVVEKEDCYEIIVTVHRQGSMQACPKQ